MTWQKFYRRRKRLGIRWTSYESGGWYSRKCWNKNITKNIAARKPQNKKIKENIVKTNYRGTVKKKRISFINSNQLGASNQGKGKFKFSSAACRKGWRDPLLKNNNGKVAKVANGILENIRKEILTNWAMSAVGNFIWRFSICFLI